MAVPQQCPDCGRFLSKTFVSGLAEQDAPCPKCASVLTAPMFGLEVEEAEEVAAEPEVADGDAAAAAAVSGAALASESVRPPDLDPADLGERDVLAGWEMGGGTAPDQGVVALPLEAALGIGAVCAVAGFAVARKRPGLGAILGATSGLVLSAVLRARGGGTSG